MPGARPNVLLVVTDQQRPDLFGAEGRVPIRTPAYDRLAAEGITLSRTYVTCPLCTPSRASIVSGQYPARHGTWFNGVPAPADMLSLPALLADRAGYRTAIVGKSHLQPCVPIGSDSYTGFVPPDPPDIGIESAPRAWDWDYFRSWSGPWYGFEHACISVGHTYDHNGYSMHYGAWLQDNGIPMEPPYFLSRQEAEGLFPHGEHGIPAVRNRTAEPPDDEAPPATWALPERFHSSTWVADSVISYLGDHVEARGDEPFFISANFPDPHNPLVVPEPWDTMYEDVELPPPARRLGEWEGKPSLYQATVLGTLASAAWAKSFPPRPQGAIVTPDGSRNAREERFWRTYMGMQSLVDKHLGRILDELDRLGLAENTIVIATSDHGDYMGDHFIWGKGGPHYDGATRVPLIVRWPGHAPAGVRSASLQSLADLAPTIMTAAGLEPHPEMQGVDQTPAWSDQDAKVRDGVLVEHRFDDGLHLHSFITDRHRLSMYSNFAEGETELELYDLQEDPQELDSIADDPGSHGVLNELIGEAWRETVELQAPWPERISRA